MASILRSSKFVRYIAGFARNVVVNTPREFDGNFVNTNQCFCGALPRNLATQASSLTDQNLETSLKRIDQDVRKSGRISRRDIEDVLEEIRNTRSATSSQSLLVIRCCGNLVPEELPETRTKLVQEIWNTLNKLKVPMDISHYNALLRVYLENEHSFSPIEFLSELERNGIEPNRVTYQRLIARYCQIGDIEGATKILEFMREKQLAVNENVFNALIVGHSQCGDMDSARGILSVMAQAGLEASADTYTTLLCGYAKVGDIEAIKKIIEECENKEIFLLDKDYLDIIYSLATNGHKEHIPFLLSKIRRAIGYNQDAVNIILRLVNKGQEEAAFLVLQSMPRGTKEDGSLAPSGHFFIKQLVKANRPLDTILDLCKRFEEEGMYAGALLLATEVSLELGRDELAYSLLECLRQQGIEIRQHYFWPLILSKAKEGSESGVIEVLQKMSQFDITPSNETIRDFVIPNLKGKSSEILAKLREGNVSIGASSSSLVVSLLQRYEIDEAAIIARQVQAFYNPDLIKRPLTNAYIKTNDLDSYIAIIRSVHDNLDRMSAVKQTEKEPVDKSEIVGSLVLELASSQQHFLSNIELVLKELVEQGLSISTPTAEKIEEKLGEKMTESISQLLGKLTSGELSPVPQQRKSVSYVPSHQMNIPQLERLIHNLSAKNQDTNGLKRQLLTLYYRAKDLEKTEKLLEDLNKEGFIFTGGLYAQLLDIYAYHNKLEKALEYYEKLKEKEKENFKLDEWKIIALAQLLIKSGRFEEGISILENTPRDRKPERNFNYSALIWRFLNFLAEEGSVENLNTVFDILIKEGYTEPNNVILGPLIKVHLLRDELDKALEKFEWCVNQFRTTPWKNELACRLIQAEEADKLQKLTDLSTTVHGEINSLYDLVFAFVECGRIRQARKILETPGLQSRPQRINSACERYQQEGLLKSLEGLKDATKDLDHIDRADIYYQLLLGYIKQDDDEKALGLWTQMQEEDLAATDQFLLTLGNFLRNKGLQIPFIMPEESHTPAPKLPRSSTQSIFRQKVKSGDLDAALEVMNKSKEQLPIPDLSGLIEKLLQNMRVAEAVDITFDILNRDTLPVNRVFRFLLNRLASQGEVDTLNKIGSIIGHDVKRLVSFDNRFCHAHLVAGKGEEYLKKLERDVDNCTEENLAAVSDQFPRGGAYGILERYPELTERYENLAIKYGKRGIIAPLNVLWTHYFITGNGEKAEQIWSEYLKDAPRIMFQKIVHTARDTQDENLTRKLIEHLKISNVTEGAIGNAYSCLLDVLVGKEKYEEAVGTFEAAIKDVSIDTINRTAVLRIKEVYEKLGRVFDHPIPLRTAKSAAKEETD